MEPDISFRKFKKHKKLFPTIEVEDDISKQIAVCFSSLFSGEEIQEWSNQNRLIAYQNDPVGFWTEELGEQLTDDIQSMMESVRDNRVTIAKSANAVGKSYSAAGVAIWFYKCFPNSQVFVAAAPPESNLRNILWSKISTQITKHPDLFVGDILNELQITRSTELNPKIKTDSFVAGLTIPTQGTEATREAKFSGKHAPNLLFILDEGDAIPNECYRGIESCMSGGFARMLIMFNPRRQTGRAYNMMVDGSANVVEMSAFNHPNVVTGRNIIPGAVTRDVTVKRINDHTTALPPNEERDDNCFEVPDFLVGTTADDGRGNEYPPLKAGFRRVKETSNEFYYMVLGRYPSVGTNQLIAREWVKAARFRWDMWVTQYGENPPPNVRPILGHDIADEGDDRNVVCKRYSGWVPPLITWRGVNSDTSIDRCGDIAQDCNAEYVNADSTGVGSSAAPKLKKRGIKAYRIMMQEAATKELETNSKLKESKGLFYRLRDQILWDLREWLRTDPSSTLPPDDKLIDELTVLDYKEDETTGRIKVMGNEKIKELLGRSADRLMSLALTFAPPNKKVPKARSV